MKNKIIIILSLVFAISCTNDQNPNGGINSEADTIFQNAALSVSDSLLNLPILNTDSLITIQLPTDLDDPNQHVKASEVFESIRYVPLETTEQCIIAGIESSIIFQNRIYILDNIGKSIFLFNDQGKFIRKIGQKGKGPEEFMNPITIDIDEKAKELYVLDDRASKFLIYDLEGSFIKEERVNFWLNDFEILNDSTYVVNTDVRNHRLPSEIANNKLIFTDKKWGVLAKGLEYDATNNSGVAYSRPGLYKFGEEVLYNPFLNYYIFTISHLGLKPKYFIDAGNSMVPQGFGYRLSIDDFNEKYYSNVESPYIFIDGPIIETEDYLLTQLRYKRREFNFFYSKKSSTLLSGFSFMHEQYKHSILAPIKGLSSEGEPYGFIEAIAFYNELNAVKKQNAGYVDPKWNSIAADHNPIFVFYKLKSF